MDRLSFKTSTFLLIASVLSIFIFIYDYKKREQFLDAAESLYKKNEYKKTIDLLIQKKQSSYPYWFMLGNCYFNLADHSSALLCWLLAKRLHSCPEVDHNISLASKKLSISQSLSDKLYVHPISSIPWSILQILALITILSLVFMYLYYARRSIQCTTLFFFIFLHGIMYVKYIEDNRSIGIVIKDSPLLTNPYNENNIVQLISRGIPVVVFSKKSGEHIFIQMGQCKGWINSADISQLC